MGTYYNPPSDVQHIGRLLHEGTYGILTAQLREGEVLVGLYQRLDYPWMNAVHLFRHDEMLTFSHLQARGKALLLGYYAVSRSSPGWDRLPDTQEPVAITEEEYRRVKEILDNE